MSTPYMTTINNALIEQMDRLNKANSSDEIKDEASRTNSMVSVAGAVAENCKIQVDAFKLLAEGSVVASQVKQITG